MCAFNYGVRRNKNQDTNVIIGKVISHRGKIAIKTHLAPTPLSTEIDLKISVRNMPDNLDFLRNEIVITGYDKNSISDLGILKKMCAHLITELEEIKTKKCDDNRNRKQG